jgi:hypothetical protein
MKLAIERGDRVKLIPAEAFAVINAKCEIKGNVRQHTNTRSSYPNRFCIDTNNGGGSVPPVLHIAANGSSGAFSTKVLGVFRHSANRPIDAD